MSSLLKTGTNWKKGRNGTAGKKMGTDISRVERQELHCHACDNFVRFSIDLSLNGNHVFKCPSCQHEHCRVVRDGKITDDRWDQRNGYTYQAIASGYSATSTSAGNFYLYGSWATATNA